eukprot:11576283-Alexandrium_andersonii.AAC.1
MVCHRLSSTSSATAMVNHRRISTFTIVALRSGANRPRPNAQVSVGKAWPGRFGAQDGEKPAM